MASIERTIFEKLKEICSEITWIKTVEIENIKSLISDYEEHELPAIQIFDADWAVKHLNCMIEKEWRIKLELVIKSTETTVLTQLDLFDYLDDVEEKFGANVRLRTSNGMFHIRYIGGVTDINQAPFMIAQLDFAVLFEKKYVS